MESCIVDEAYLATWSARWLSQGPGPQSLSLIRPELAANPALCQAVELLLQHRRGIVQVQVSSAHSELRVNYLASLWERSELTRELHRAVDIGWEQQCRRSTEFGAAWN